MFVNKIGFLFLIFNHFEACSSDSSTATEKITESSSSSSSKTEYVFATERISIVENFTKPSIIISAYYEEKGFQFSRSDEIASRNIAYLLVSERGYKYSGWLLSNMYWEGNEVCEYELAFFKNECNQYNG